MSHYKSGMLFSVASGNDSVEKSPDSGVHRGPKMGSMMAVPNEYSDLEEEDEYENGEENEYHNEYHNGDSEDNDGEVRGYEKNPHSASSNQFTQSQSQTKRMPKMTPNTQNTQNSILSQYGIGAKLLLGMGYQEGKGLGSRQNGIAAPIETKLRPQGLGVGGIREKNQPKKVQSSDDEEYALPKGIVSFSKPTYDLFPLIDSLERAGVNVPIYYKQLSDNASSENPLDLEKAHAKLSSFSSKLTSIDTKIQALRLEIDHIDSTLDTDKLHRSALDVLISKLRDTDENDITKTTALLEQLTQEPFARLPDIQRIFVAYCKKHVTTLFSSIDENALDQLSQWAVLYRNLEHSQSLTGLNLWDSMILQLLKNNVDTLQGSPYDIRFWLDSPVVINSPLVEQVGLEEIVMPTTMKTIQHWDLAAGFESRIIECLSDFDWDDSRRRHIVEVVSDKYVEYFSGCWQELSLAQGKMWHFYQQKMRPVLEHLVSTGAVLIGQYHEKKVSELRKNLILALVRFCVAESHSTHNTTDKVPALVLEFQHSFGLISSAQSEIILVFTVLNPLVREMQSMLQQQKSPLSLFYRWQENFSSLSRDYPDTKRLFIWYTNVFIVCMRSWRTGVSGTIKLPSCHQEENPVQELESLVLGENKNIASAYSVAASDLLVTFKDVVQQYCSQYNVVFYSTGRRDAKMNEICELRFSSGENYECFISNDVLWVGDSGDFSPVDVTDFLGGHNT